MGKNFIINLMKEYNVIHYSTFYEMKPAFEGIHNRTLKEKKCGMKFLKEDCING